MEIIKTHILPDKITKIKQLQLIKWYNVEKFNS